MIKLLTSFPTSVFTVLLAFCLTWWIVTTLLSGIDTDADFDNPHGQPGHVGHGHAPGGQPSHGSGRGAGRSAGRHGVRRVGGRRAGQRGQGTSGGGILSDFFSFGVVPLPLALTIVTFGAWSVSLVLQQLAGNSSGHVAVVAGIALAAVALLAGSALLRTVRTPVGKMFDMEIAPGRDRSVGATCKVRTLVVTERLGDAEVLTGPTRGSLIKVRADEGRFTRGDIAVIVDYDPATEAFVIDELDESLRPG
jgi:hypothetical protein